MNNKEPIEKATANFRGLIASSGKVRKAMRKQKAAPRAQMIKPKNLSHRESAK